MHNDIPYKNNPMGYYTELNNIQPFRAFVSPGHTFNNETVGLEFHFYCDFLDNNKVVLVDWGDGSVEYDIAGTDLNITHDYLDNGDYFPVVTGCVDEITSFDTNAIVVWERI